VVLRECDPDNPRHFGDRPRTGEDLVPEKLQRCQIRLVGLGPVQQLDAGLHRAVIAADDLAHARGVRTAADVLEQQRVVELVQVRLRKARPLTNAHAEQAGADAVTGHRTLGKIKGKGERGDDFRKMECLLLHWIRTLAGERA
jgi:hypothetical protein